MKEDKLKDFIQEHRSDFDGENPPPMVWMNLEKELAASQEKQKSAYVHELKRPTMMRVMQVAAMFVVVMGVGLIIGLQISKNSVYDNPNLKEFVEVEKHYSKKVDNMWTVVKASGVEEQNNIQADLESLDKVYNELKEELLKGEHGNTNEVVNAMIQNYRTKIDILETVIDKTKQSNQQINLEHEKLEI